MSSAGIIIHLGPGSKDRVFVKLENLGENWEMLTLKSSQKFWEKNGKFWGGNFSENVVKFLGKKLRASKNLVGPGHPRASAHLWFQSINQSIKSSFIDYSFEKNAEGFTRARIQA